MDRNTARLCRSTEDLHQTRLGRLAPPTILMQEACALYWEVQFDNAYTDLSLGSLDVTPLECLHSLAKLLATGHASPAVQEQLADFLIDVLGQADASARGKTEADALAHRILDTANPGRPAKYAQQAALVKAFEAAMSEGLDPEQACRRAYDAYYASDNRTFAADARKEIESPDGKSVAERSMNKVIRPMLRGEGLLQRRSPGRKKKGKPSDNDP